MDEKTYPEKLRELIWGFGGRSFILVIGASITNTGLFIFAGMSEGGYVTLTLGTLGAFIAKEVTEGIKTKLSD